MKISELATCTNLSTVSLEGIIVFIDKRLSLIDFDYGDDYRKTARATIVNKDLDKTLSRSVALYGGGESGLFHDVKLSGYVIANNPEKGIGLFVTELLIRDGNGTWKDINLENHQEIDLGGGEHRPDDDWFEILGVLGPWSRHPDDDSK